MPPQAPLPALPPQLATPASTGTSLGRRSHGDDPRAWRATGDRIHQPRRNRHAAHRSVRRAAQRRRVVGHHRPRQRPRDLDGSRRTRPWCSREDPRRRGRGRRHRRHRAASRRPGIPGVATAPPPFRRTVGGVRAARCRRSAGRLERGPPVRDDVDEKRRDRRGHRSHRGAAIAARQAEPRPVGRLDVQDPDRSPPVRRVARSDLGRRFQPSSSCRHHRTGSGPHGEGAPSRQFRLLRALSPHLGSPARRGPHGPPGRGVAGPRADIE